MKDYSEYSEIYPNIGKKWDDSENNRLLSLLKTRPKMPIETVAYNMGRSINSIKIQSTKLLQELIFDFDI